MLTFSQSALRKAFNVVDRTSSNWCAGLPFQREGRTKRYNVADLLPSLPGKYAAAVPALIKLARNDDNPVVADVSDIDRARALDGWLNLHMPEAGARLYNVRQAFFGGLALGFRSSALMGETEFLRLILPRHGAILAYLTTGNPDTLPRDWVTWSRELAVTHIGLERVAA